MATRTPLLALGLLLALSATVAADIAAEYGVCPKYIVATGDTLFDISARLGVASGDLLAATAACGDQTANLQIGQEICLPGYDVELCKDVVETDPVRPWCQVYIVQQGDTTASVAAKFGIKQDELVALNSDYLDDGYTLPYAGQYVRLPGWNQVQCRDYNDNDLAKCQMYVVQTGDTATEIAQKYKVDLQEMLKLNELTDNATLVLNQRVKLPKWSATCPVEGIPAVLPSDTVECRVTMLQMGESLALLAERYKTSLSTLLEVNPSFQPTNGSLLQPGTYVNIPAFPASCVGLGNLVGVAGSSEVPAAYDYNGLGSGATPTPASPPAAAAPAPAGAAPVEAPAASPVEAPTPAAATPSPAPSSAPATAPAASVVPAPAPAPSAAAPALAASSFLAAALALLAGALLL